MNWFKTGKGVHQGSILSPCLFNVHTEHIMEKAREFQKNIYFCFIDYAKAFDCVDHSKLWKIDRKSTRLNSSHIATSRMPSSA